MSLRLQSPLLKLKELPNYTGREVQGEKMKSRPLFHKVARMKNYTYGEVAFKITLFERFNILDCSTFLNDNIKGKFLPDFT